MEDFSNSVMIALLPITSDWCKIELPHVTLVYAGEITDLKPTVFNEMAKATASLAFKYEPVLVKVIGMDIFGEEEQVEVLLLDPSIALRAMRYEVESWNASTHPFKPHATVGPVGSIDFVIPNSIGFDRIAFAWGDVRLTFELGTGIMI